MVFTGKLGSPEIFERLSMRAPAFSKMRVPSHSQSSGHVTNQSRVENYKPAQQISTRCDRRIVINYLYRRVISLYLYSLNKMFKHHNYGIYSCRVTGLTYLH